MNSIIKNKIMLALNKEFLRRSLNKYFMEKGYDNFLKSPYPPTLMDMTSHLGLLDQLVEISYNIEDINLQNNVVKLAWNIFVLGNKRIFLGNTSHSNLTDIESSVGMTDKHHDGPHNIKQIIDNIVRFISESESIMHLKDLKDAPKKKDMDSMFGRQYKVPMPFRRVNL